MSELLLEVMFDNPEEDEVPVADGKEDEDPDFEIDEDIIANEGEVNNPDRAGEVDNPDRAGEADDDDEQDSAKCSIRIVEETMKKLLDNFAHYDFIAPIVCVGNSKCGRSNVLDSLIQEIPGDQGRIVSPFASNGRKLGVYVLPYPVQMGSVTVMLIKMWGMDFHYSCKSLSTLGKNVISALFCISSTCLVCTKRDSFLPTLEALEELYSKVTNATGLNVSKFVALADNKANISSPNIQTKLAELRRKTEGKIAQYFVRGQGISRACADRLRGFLSNPETHASFFASHQDAMATFGPRKMIFNIEWMLALLVRIVNFDLHFQSFADRIPRFSGGDLGQQLRNLDDFEEHFNLVNNGRALDFLVKDGNAYILSPSVIEKLQAGYNLGVPTVVMVIIGSPGVGKSTLLNHLVRASIGSRRCLKWFKVGKTTSHTTLASQVFSQQLNINGHQLMLIDLEGLDGTENFESVTNETTQKKLRKAILTIASMPCILIRNEKSDLELVKNIASEITKLQSEYFFKTDCMHLFFQDTDLESAENENIRKFINKNNSGCLKDGQVLKLRNRPDFRSEKKADMRETFIRKLFEDCNYPKRSKFGNFINIENLLVEIQKIMAHPGKSLLPISLSEAETIQKNHLETEMMKQLRVVVTELTCPKNTSIITIFDQQHQTFMNKCKFKMAEQTENVRSYVTKILENQARVYRIELSKIEYCYYAISRLAAAELAQGVQELLEYFHRDALWIGTFDDRASELELKLKTVAKMYPHESNKLRAVIKMFEEKRDYLRKKIIANYAVQVASLLIGSAGLAAKGASLAVTIGEVVFHAFANGLAVTGRLIYSISRSLSLTDTASVLYSMNRSGVKVDSKVSKLLEVGGDANLFVLLAVGTKRTIPNCLLNEFVHQAFPLTPAALQAFKHSKLTQVLHSSYQHPNLKGGNTHVFLIYLQIYNQPNKRGSIRVHRLATELLGKVPLTCLFFDPLYPYVDSMITDVLETAQRRNEQDLLFRSPLVVLYPQRDRPSDFFMRLTNCNRPCIEVPIQRFDEQSLKPALVTVKSELDRSTPISPSVLLEILKNAADNTNI